MEKAIVLGATGAMGYALVHRLQSSGVKTYAYCRHLNRAKELFGDLNHVEVIEGDVRDTIRLEQAMKEVDITFVSLNIPYQKWSRELLPLFEEVFKVAFATKTKVAVVDNIYSYKTNEQLITEDTPREPETNKGKLRKELYLNMQAWMKKGLSIVIAHFPDFYGPHADNTMLQQTIQTALAGKRPLYLGPMNKKREFIYTFDGADALITLAMDETAYQQSWNIPGTKPENGQEIISILQRLTGNTKKPFVVRKPMIRFLGFFSPFMRELTEMMDLTENPVFLDGTKYEQAFVPRVSTSFDEGLRQVIKQMQKPT
ncbi:nucleoside-diphosphate-sugar epimerase [Halalkalibacter nanhaiisediminis]|uniref:Nucleoside-diphosphate-sugar epimerase n=2 Tax=Halalkalibacter nanhaiisediminis TaxID=688079 RepID=A0A562QM75_9BACI|nr:nucleoside-diphosphate-sugar epimerase [Halalkalibacter nanhaiisediminis]